LKIQLKRSSVLELGSAKEPTSAQMEYGELAVNYSNGDPAIFLKDSNNNIIRIAGVGNINAGDNPSGDVLPPTGNNVGDIFFNTSNNTMYYWDGSVWVPIANDVSAADIFVGTLAEIDAESPAADRRNGFLWWNTEDGTLYIWYIDDNTSQFVIAIPSSGGGGGASVVVNDIPPGDAVQGDMWWNTTDGRLYIYYQDELTSQWVDASPDSYSPDVYVEKAGDNMTGDLTFGTGPNTKLDVSGTAIFSQGNIVFNLDGSAELAGGILKIQNDGSQKATRADATCYYLESLTTGGYLTLYDDAAGATIQLNGALGTGTFTGNLTLPGGGGATDALQKQEIDGLINSATYWGRNGTTLKPANDGDSIEADSAIFAKGVLASEISTEKNDAAVNARQYTTGGYNFNGNNAAGTSTFSVTEAGKVNSTGGFLATADATYLSYSNTPGVVFGVYSNSGSGIYSTISRDGSAIFSQGNIKLNADGSADLAGGILKIRNDGSQLATRADNICYFLEAETTGGYLSLYGGSADPSIQLNGATGGATFKGPVQYTGAGGNYCYTIGGATTSSGGLYMDGSAAGALYLAPGSGQAATISLTGNNGDANFSGSVTSNGTVLTSDARFKENITPAKSQLADVVALGSILKNYNWNDDAPVNEQLRSVRQLGLIAQEAAEICPSLVKEIHGTKDDSYKGISSDALIMKLLGAVADLSAKVTQLEGGIN